MLNQGIADHLRGHLWAKLLNIDRAQAIHSNNLYQKLCQFKNDETER